MYFCFGQAYISKFEQDYTGGNYSFTDLDIAYENSHKCLDIALEIQDQLYEGKAHENLGSYYYFKQEWENATEYLNRAEKIAEKINSSLFLSSVYHTIGTLNLVRDRSEVATKYYRKSIRVNSYSNNFLGLAGTYRNLMYIELNVGHISQAKIYADSSAYFFRILGLENRAINVIKYVN